MSADMKGYDPDDNSARSYELAIAAAREISIRKHQILPRVGDKKEARWALEGSRSNAELETVVGEVPFQ